MKIAQVSTVVCQCGIATYTGFLSEALIKLGHEVMIFGEKKGGDAPCSVPYKVCYKREDNDSYIQLRDEIDAWRPDIVHVQYEWALHMTDGLIWELGRPRQHFMTWHNVVPDQKSYFYGHLADRHIVHNDPCKAVLNNHLSTMSKVIPHGTRKNEITETSKAKEMLGIDPSKKVIGIYGFVSPRKGHHILLGNLERIQKYCPGATLMFIGGPHPLGSGADNYVKLMKVAAERYPKDVLMTGYLDDEKKTDLYLSATDMVMFPHIGGQDLISASGSVRRTIDHGKLLAVTDIPFYSEFTPDMCLRIPTQESFLTLGRWIGRNLAKSDSPEMLALRANLKLYARETYWEKVARKHVDYYLEALS